MRESEYRIRNTFPERRQTGLRTRSALRAGHIRSFLWRQGIRDAFVIAGPVPVKRSERESFGTIHGPYGTPALAVPAYSRISIHSSGKCRSAGQTRLASMRQKTSGPGILAENRGGGRSGPYPTEKPAERPGAVGLGSKSGKRPFRTVRHQRGVIAFGK